MQRDESVEIRLGASEFFGNGLAIGNDRLNVQIPGCRAGATSLKLLQGCSKRPAHQDLEVPQRLT